MDTNTSEHVRELLEHLSKIQADLAKLSHRVKRTKELLEHEILLENWSVPANLEDRPHLGILG